MPAQPQRAASTNFEIDHGTHTIRLSRILDASCDEVFDAWTTQDDMRCWWDAAGETLALCEIDLRVGGAFKFVSRGHPDMPFAGLYREIVRPERLIFEAMGATGRVLLQNIGGKTHMTVEIACATGEQLNNYLKMGIAAGTSQTLDNLVAYLDRGAFRT